MNEAGLRLPQSCEISDMQLYVLKDEEMLTGGRNLSISIFFSAVGKGKHDHLHPLYYFIFMHIVSLYRKRSRELHEGKGKGC